MVTNYLYKQKELGSQESESQIPSDPQNWSILPEGEKIRLCPTPGDPYAARKSGDHMVIHGVGGSVLDENHEIEKSNDPIAGETRRVRMRCQ